jgi:hypothetical protein
MRRPAESGFGVPPPPEFGSRTALRGAALPPSAGFATLNPAPPEAVIRAPRCFALQVGCCGTIDSGEGRYCAAALGSASLRSPLIFLIAGACRSILLVRRVHSSPYSGARFFALLYLYPKNTGFKHRTFFVPVLRRVKLYFFKIPMDTCCRVL